QLLGVYQKLRRFHCAVSTVTLKNDAVYLFNDPATPEIYTLSLHDALPISRTYIRLVQVPAKLPLGGLVHRSAVLRLVNFYWPLRSEEHTSELQSPYDLVCRLLLEKKKKIINC